MKPRFVPLMLALMMTGLTGPVQAQDDQGQIWEVQTISVRPDHIDEFMAAVGEIRAAAEAANLAEEWAWHIWSDGFDVMIASPTQNMASFDDPEAWMRAFQGTPGEAILNEAMQKIMTEISAFPIRDEVMIQDPDWAYEPQTPRFEQPSFAEMIEFRIRPGMAEQLEAVIGELMAFQEKTQPDSPMNGYRVRFGDVGRVVFLIFTDSWANFYGPYSMEAKVKADGTEAEWEAIMTRFRDCILDFNSTQIAYHADLSYTGPGM